MVLENRARGARASRLSLGILSFLLGLGLAPSPARAEATTGAASNTAATSNTADATLAEAKLHFSNGVDLLQETPPNYQDAIRQFQLAYDKSGGSWKVLGNLGLCALKLERDGEALHYYEDYLKGGAENIDPSERAAIERDILLVRGNMATFTLRSSQPNTKITVTRKGSEVPAQTYSLPSGDAVLELRAGELTLVAASGELRETWQVVVGPTEQASHEFSFAAPKAEPVAAAPPPPVAAESQKGGPTPVRVAGYVTGGVGILGLIGGVVVGALAKSAESDAAAQCIDDVCRESTQADFDSAANLATVANVLLISGGVLTATGLTLVLVGGQKDESPSTARLRISPLGGAGLVGLSAGGHF